MSAATAEFSRLVPLARLGPGVLRQQIAAGPGECEALAGRFGLVALDRLSAAVELRRGADGTVLLEAAFEAAFVQTCVVTLDPVPGTIADRFSLVYGPQGAAEDKVSLSAEEIAFEPLAGDAIDIGEAVAQELSLQLPRFPRLADATIAALTEPEPPPPEEPVKN